MFPDLPAALPDEISKTEFARQRDISPGRVSQMIRDGLPTTPAGRIPVEAADAWIAANVRHRTSKVKADAAELSRVKIEREAAQRDLLRLQVAEKERRLIDRKTVEQAIFELARAERDAHLSWVARIASPVAAEITCDPGALYAALDREMRRHLADLSETPIEDLVDDAADSA